MCDEARSIRTSVSGALSGSGPAVAQSAPSTTTASGAHAAEPSGGPRSTLRRPVVGSTAQSELPSTPQTRPSNAMIGRPTTCSPGSFVVLSVAASTETTPSGPTQKARSSSVTTQQSPALITAATVLSSGSIL